jgi:hypothetical protein
MNQQHAHSSFQSMGAPRSDFPMEIIWCDLVCKNITSPNQNTFVAWGMFANNNIQQVN